VSHRCPPVTTGTAYWCWTLLKLLCVTCWQSSGGVPGQFMGPEDIKPGERCGHCGGGLT
jgi:hypothetical protein